MDKKLIFAGIALFVLAVALFLLMGTSPPIPKPEPNGLACTSQSDCSARTELCGNRDLSIYGPLCLNGTCECMCINCGAALPANATKVPANYAAECKKRIIQMGVSEDYFNSNIVPISFEEKNMSNNREDTVSYLIITNTWVGNLSIECWMNRPNDLVYPTVWAIQPGGRMWWNEAVQSGADAKLREYHIALTEQEAIDLASGCLGTISYKRIFFNIDSGILFLASSETKQARINLETGELMECDELQIVT